MIDKDYAQQALSTLEPINVDVLDQDARDANDQVVAAVDELAVGLKEANETADEPSVETPDE